MATMQKGFAGEVDGQPFFIGTWWWTLYGIHKSAYGVEPEQVLQMLADNHVTEIYLDVSGMNPDDQPVDPYGATFSEVRAFAAACYKLGIRLSALTGCSRNHVVTWLDPKRGYPEIMDFLGLVEAYNDSVDETERFTAVHLDVEPHSADRFLIKRAEMLQLYADAMLRAAKRCHDKGLNVETDVCGGFFDNDMVTVNGKEVPIMDALFEACHTITVMAYRRDAERQMEFGTRRYLPYAVKHGKRLVVGCETMKPEYDLDVDDIPKEITYGSIGRDAMLREVDRLQHMLLQTSVSSVGIAIHHVYSWYDLFYKLDPKVGHGDCQPV